MHALFLALALTAQCSNGQCSARATSWTVVVAPAPVVVPQPVPGFTTKTVVKVRSRPRLFGGLFRR